MGHLGEKSCRVTFLDLPNDILCEILDYFQFVDRNGKKIDWIDHHRQAISEENKARRQIVQRLRLVCRHLSQLVSPLLCPVLRVSLDQGSLDAVKHLSQNPFIATGVRGIFVSLEYRPQELATNLTQYIKHQRNNLGMIERQCYDFAGERFPRDRDSETWHQQQAPWPSWFKSYLKSIYRIHSACLAWNTDRNTAENINHARDEERREDLEIIIQGFEDYRQRHEKQSKLVTDGCFVNTLASCAIHMRNATGVVFYYRNNYFNIYGDDLASFEAKANIFETIAAPLGWRRIEELEGRADIIPARIFSELPIAFHRSGVKLHSISIECFPTTRGFSLIAPGQQSNSTWIDLRNSCQYLKQFQLGEKGMNLRPIRYEYLTAEEKEPIDNYLDAVFSSAFLEHLSISLYPLSLNDGRTKKEGYYRLGPIPRTVDWQRMRRLRLEDVECDQDDLEKLFRSFGHSLEELTLDCIKLRKGNWSSVFDILRGRLQERYLRQKFRASVSGLSGGEFGIRKTRHQISRENREPDWEETSDHELYTEWEEDEELKTQIEKYICGDGVCENPLVGSKLRQTEN